MGDEAIGTLHAKGEVLHLSLTNRQLSIIHRK